MPSPNLFVRAPLDIKANPPAALSERELTNSVSGICQLPDELTVHIISELQIAPNQPEAWHSSEFNNFDEDNISWIRMTWICRRIRHIAIATPKLWTRVYSKQAKEWNTLVVARAQDTDICIDISYSYTEDVITPGEHIFQAKYLRITHGGKRTWKALIPRRDTPTPTRVTIFHTTLLPNATAINFLASIAEHLVELSLGDTNGILLAQLVWPRLRRLRLKEPCINPESLTVILQGMPRIEVLSIFNIRHVSSSDVDSNNGISKTSSCDRPRKVAIVGLPRDVLQLVECISHMKRTQHRACLDLQVEHWWDLSLRIVALLAHLTNEWGWEQPVCSGTLFKTWSHPSDLYSLVLHPGHSLTAAHAPAPADYLYMTSKIKILCKLGHEQLFHNYRFEITSLEIEGVGRPVRKEFFDNLDELISPTSFPHIARIVFRHMNDTQLIRGCVQERELAGGPALDVVCEQCEDSNYVMPADEGEDTV
jgi:hypothetical protein